MREFPSQRPPPGQRRFVSAALEDQIQSIAARIHDRQLAWMFANCLPNTLDTTVEFDRDARGTPDTFVTTGDIAAMWLRDSTAQVWPYLALAADDAALRELVAGVVRRQTACVLLDPYANAFYREREFGVWRNDHTRMVPGVHERKWELDSLMYFLRLSCGYWESTGDVAPFDAAWRDAVSQVLAVLRREQAGYRSGDTPDYTFRRTGVDGDSLVNDGRGDPAKPCGLVRGAFRPSDDRTKLPFHVPTNAMAVVALRSTVRLLEHLGHAREAVGCRDSADAIGVGLEACAVVSHARCGEIWAYEVDGYGGAYLMDDANVPNLLALPYLGFCAPEDPRYHRTREFVLSPDNPYWVAGAAARGLGSPHTGLESIWPLGLVMQALTATEDAEIVACLRFLCATHAGTGFMHESFDRDDPGRFSRPWFGWANSLFGELVLTLASQRPHLLTLTYH